MPERSSSLTGRFQYLWSDVRLGWRHEHQCASSCTKRPSPWTLTTARTPKAVAKDSDVARVSKSKYTQCFPEPVPEPYLFRSCDEYVERLLPVLCYTPSTLAYEPLLGFVHFASGHVRYTQHRREGNRVRHVLSDVRHLKQGRLVLRTTTR